VAEIGEAADGTVTPDERRRLQGLADVMAHPVRNKVLYALIEKPGVTIRQMAERISEPPRRVRYHLEKMVKEGLVMVDEESIRPKTIERRYRATCIPVIESDEMVLIDPDQRRKIALEVLKAVFADARAAITAGTFGIHEGHVEIRWPAEVDRQGWEELTEIHDKAFRDIGYAIARVQARIAAGGEPVMATTSALFLFEVPRWNTE
jgi:DNA-binding transcriptional ArsR family regulator